MFDPIRTRIDMALAAMASDPPADTPELDALFDRLREPTSTETRRATERRIWSIWCSHDDAEATAAMRQVIQSFEMGDLATTGETLDQLIDRWPGWAEPWNKRATLHFVQDRDAASLEDIARTLEREPRHFGALSGFGEICLRAGEITPALFAFERVLALDPSLKDVGKAVHLLRERASDEIH